MKVSCQCGHRFDLIVVMALKGSPTVFRDIVLGSWVFGQVVQDCPGCGRRLKAAELLRRGATLHRDAFPTESKARGENGGGP